MDGQVVVGIAFRIADDVAKEIEAVDPRIVLRRLPALSAPTTTPQERAELLAAIAEVDILLGPNTVDGEYLRAARNLKWYQLIVAGADHLHKEGLLNLGFQVTNVSGMVAVAIAEYTIATMLMLSRNLHGMVRQQIRHEWIRTGLTVRELSGQTIGIVGMGAIGRETARRARAFGMRIIASRRTVPTGATDPDCDLMLPFSDLDTLLEQSDYLVLCVPLTPETNGLIGAAQLRKMKPTASLINIARGSVVDQDALIAALQDGTIASAALDVTEPEPLPADSPLWDMPNVIITPHTSGAVQGYGHRSAEIFIANLRRFLAGQPLGNLVDPTLGY